MALRFGGREGRSCPRIACPRFLPSRRSRRRFETAAKKSSRDGDRQDRLARPPWQGQSRTLHSDPAARMGLRPRLERLRTTRGSTVARAPPLRWAADTCRSRARTPGSRIRLTGDDFLRRRNGQYIAGRYPSMICGAMDGPASGDTAWSRRLTFELWRIYIDCIRPLAVRLASVPNSGAVIVSEADPWGLFVCAPGESRCDHGCNPH